MAQRTQPAITAEERYREAIAKELSDFVDRERELMAQERQERADRLGIAHLVRLTAN